jgi:succinate dehydrogenase/fumarate reductase flavoprotein subunit
MDHNECDVLVLGGGLAGFCAAAGAAREGKKVAMVTMGGGASPYIVALNCPLATPHYPDGPEVYASDILRAGCRLNESNLVACLASSISEWVSELEKMGVQLERDGETYARRHLAGSTYPRAVYIKAGTGPIILGALEKQCVEAGVAIYKGWRAVSLLQDDGAVVGALGLRTREKKITAYRAGAVVLALGGLGRIYEESTYPFDVRGDSYTLAYHSMATLIDMEFVQFEPTIVIAPPGCKGMEMPTAMLGDGAQLKNRDGERFMFRYNPQHGELQIEKAKLSLAIQKEIDEGRGLDDGTVYFDTTVMPEEKLESYLSHCKRLRNNGCEPRLEAPHVRPMAHSFMGGIQIDENGFSGVEGLFACGEATGGIHGASRIAGNSGSEAVVFGFRAGISAARSACSHPAWDWAKIQNKALGALTRWIGSKGQGDLKAITQSVQSAMKRGAGLYRDGEGLASAIEEMSRASEKMDRISGAEDEFDAVEFQDAQNTILLAKIVLNAARIREESRGAHQRRDFPNQNDDQWLKHISVKADRTGEPTFSFLPVR